jgi:ABC-2 type transport system ATP-binding protein
MSELSQSDSETNTEPIVAFEDVSKTYKDVQALSNVSFEIPRGSVFGYIGPNGAGKTTTIKILVGLIRDFDGDVYVDGRRISEGMSDIHRKLGYLPQEVGFQNWRTVGQMLTTFGRLSGLPKTGLEKRVGEVLELVALPDVQDRRIVHLSGGMQQKLRLAQSLLHDPELIILDEPMAGLDPASRHQVKLIIKRLSERGATVFFSSHILSDVQDIATLIGILNKGQLMRVGTPDELQSHFQVGNDIEIVVAEGSVMCSDFEDIPGVDYLESTSSKRQVLHLTSDADIDTVIAEVVRKLLSEGCRLRQLNLLKPSLEEVYLRYIGGES